ncbi:unnamed protein product [Angiostrongylus costaricensis]|uniref:Ig-like domain-containing protein n=1 Tax=Angiostrongylus costaricensis TaxID=334426 RepID=A0A0R3PFC0_ANGCS|nr:unnamed protein product [Angiostrongylus costaricensis]
MVNSSRTMGALIIRGIEETDGGIYGCQAENSVGRSVVLETHVVIVEPPTFLTRPPPELRVPEGAPVNVNCRGFGDPLPIAYWVHLKKSRPQAAVIDRVECVGGESMKIYWTPVCSTLPAPSNVRISGESELRWDPVEHARSYRVESRHDKASTFEEIVCFHAENVLNSQWYGLKTDSALQASFEVRGSLKDEVDYCFSEETPNAIDDMLREKYLFGVQNVPVQLMNDLRIERLRREFRLSHL